MGGMWGTQYGYYKDSHFVNFQYACSNFLSLYPLPLPMHVYAHTLILLHDSEFEYCLQIGLKRFQYEQITRQSFQRSKYKLMLHGI